MGVEVVGADIASVDVDTKAEMDNSIVHAKENGKVDESEPNQAIKFGSLEEPAKGETISVSDSNLPKDAVDEWPAIKQIHSFYFVRHRPYDDPKIKTKIEHADKEITNTNQARSRITDELRTHRSKRAELKSQVRALITDSQQYRAVMDEKRKQLGPLQQALGQLRNPNSSSRGGGGLCSSEEELNDLIHSLNYRIQHESIPLSEEKQIMREIKQLEGTRAQVIAHAAQRAKIEDSMGQKDAIQDQVKVMGIDLDGVKKEKLAVSTRITQLDEKVKAVERDIGALQQELDVITQKRDQAFETIRALRTQRDQGNALFYQSRALLTQAKDLAAKKDIKALEELSNAEVEKFISLWSSNKAFRDDYEKRILPSLDNRQLSRDGRIRNPDEKPILAPEVPAKSEPLAKANASRPKEDAKPAPQKEDAKPIQKKETSKKDAEVAVENGRIDDKPATSELVKPQQTPPAQKVVDKEKLKELKREEEIAKAKQAMERKKKLAEKAAAKAAVKAQKEAEKKLKDREKKLKKKAAASAPANEPEEPTEAVEEAVAEAENIAVKEEAQPLAKEKGTRGKEKSIRYKNRPKGGVEPLPKAILRKRKSNNYLLWAAAVAALVLMLMVLAYYMF